MELPGYHQLVISWTSDHTDPKPLGPACSPATLVCLISPSSVQPPRYYRTLKSRVLILLLIFLTTTSQLCSWSYHWPSHSSPGPLDSWASGHLLWLMGQHLHWNTPSTHPKDVLDYMCHTMLHHPAEVARPKLLTRKKCFQSRFLQFPKGFKQFLSSLSL